MSTTSTKSMNEANDKDPFNNNSYGTLVDSGYKLVNLPVLDVTDFNERQAKKPYQTFWAVATEGVLADASR